MENINDRVRNTRKDREELEEWEMNKNWGKRDGESRQKRQRFKLQGEHKVVQGDRGEADKQQLQILSWPLGRTDSTRGCSSFSLQLACHADNYLLNTPGSDSVWALVFCQLP